MSMEVSELLAGPRGRRLCLAFALTDPHGRGPEVASLFQAVFYAGYDLDPAKGTSRVFIGPGADREDRPSSSPADVARLMVDVPLVDPDEPAVLRALADAVDSARYWQEPDGEDVLAASPELRAPLERVAAHLVDCSSADWWASGVDRSDQWAVHFAETDPPADASAVEVLDRWHTAQVDEEAAAQRDRPADPTASMSGTWWSKPPSRLPKSTRLLGALGPAGLWLVEDSMGWTSATVTRLDVPDDLHVYEIDGPDAWARLCRRYPLEVTASRRHDWYRATGRAGRWVIPDWADVARDVDAIHLTAAGYLSAAGWAIPVDDDRATVLAGWDPDQTFWLTGVGWDAASTQDWDIADGAWLRTDD